MHFFDYEVHPLETEAGTYFYHSHVGFQMGTASGPLIVEDNGACPYAYDEERIVHLSDYFNATDMKIEQGLVADPFVWSNETNAVLINGVGVSIGETAGKGGCELPVINVEPDTTYRMRFIGATALSMTQLAIIDHDNFTIVAADAQYTKPYSEKFMQVSTGQRFDVIFKTKCKEDLKGKTDYLIQFETKDRPTVYYGYGVLRYSNAKPTITTGPAKPPLALTNATYDWLEYKLEPLRSNNFPTAEEVTRRVIIDTRQVFTDTDIYRINGLQWNTSSSPFPRDRPYLVNIYETGPSAIPNYTAALENYGWDPETRTWPAKVGEVSFDVKSVQIGVLKSKSLTILQVLEIIWQNTGSLVMDNGGVDYHPFHAHGGHYFDIGSGNGTYNATENEKKLQGYNPVLRDTTNLYRYTPYTVAGIDAGWRGWRLRVEDAGVWMIHCHILQHMIMGMQTVWVMGDYKQITSIPHSDAAGYLHYGGNAVGNASYAPTVAHFFGDS